MSQQDAQLTYIAMMTRNDSFVRAQSRPHRSWKRVWQNEQASLQIAASGMGTSRFVCFETTISATSIINVHPNSWRNFYRHAYTLAANWVRLTTRKCAVTNVNAVKFTLMNSVTFFLITFLTHPIDHT